jgi:hypothetical protein
VSDGAATPDSKKRMATKPDTLFVSFALLIISYALQKLFLTARVYWMS